MSGGSFGSAVPKRYGNKAMVPTFPQAASTYTDSIGTIIVPSGALDAWYAARSRAATQFTEVVVLGDSTTAGSEGTGNNYSWIDRLRDRVIGAGFTDGGRGIFATDDTAMTGRDATYDLQTGFVSAVGFNTVNDGWDNLTGLYWASSAAGDVLNLQGYFKNARLWYTARHNDGGFTYSVDGGSAVTVEVTPDLRGSFPNGIYSRFIPITASAFGLHGVQVVNLGGVLIGAPQNVAGNVSYPTSPVSVLPEGTYYYKVTIQDSLGGETLPSAPVTVVAAISAGRQPAASIQINGGAAGSISVPTGGQFNVYKATAPGGPFYYLNSVTPTTPNNATMFGGDDGSIAVNTSRVAPTSSTIHRSGTPGVHIALAPHNGAGITWSKFARSGATLGSFFSSGSGTSPTTSAGHPDPWQTPFGLAPNDTLVSPTYAGLVAEPTYSSGDRPAPVLAIMQLGFNDLSNTAGDTTLYTESVRKFAAACRAAGCSGLVLTGQMPYHPNWTSIGPGAWTALRDAALAQGLAFADNFYPVAGVKSLDYSGPSNNPHLLKAQYQVQADWLWDNLLGVS